jgi:hypothetical protein
MPSHHQAVAKWGPALLPPVLCLILGRAEPAWIYMWLIAFSLFVSAKWLTIFPLLIAARRPSNKRLLGYCFLWPGLNARDFCFGDALPGRAGEWFAAIRKTILGAALLGFANQLIGRTNTLLVGWIGMIGVAFLLHFGFFHLLSLAWRAAGVSAPPLMRFPIGATSLTRFWNGQWNRAFSDWMQQLTRPIARRTNSRVAVLIIFLISGLLHESVISVPARAGYGLPTAYFLLQGIGQSIERSQFGNAIGLVRGWAGRCFVMLIAGLPAVVLFPPVFIERVILPMLEAL